MNKAFFFDRDGTLNIDFDYVHLKEEWEWIPGIPETLKKLHDADFRLIVVTNQSGISRGKFSLEQVNELHEWVNRDLYNKVGIQIDAFYIAPWHPDFHKDKDPLLLNERKPGTVLFERAAERFNIDFRKSFMAGDKASDITPALNLGMTPFLVSSRFTNIELLSWAFNNNVVFFPTINEAVQKVFK